MNAGELPPFIGIRLKPLTDELLPRSMRTLDIFLTALAAKTKGRCPGISRHASQSYAARRGLRAHRSLLAPGAMLDLEPGALRIELMIETPQAIINERGEVNLRTLVTAARGRCRSVHFGPYDYAASRNIASRQLER